VSNTPTNTSPDRRSQSHWFTSLLSGSSSSSFSGMLSIFLLYGFIVLLMLLLSFQFLQGLEFRQNPLLWMVIGIAVLLPLVLVVTVIYRLLRIIRDRKNHVAGAGYRLRILVGFLILILFAAIPQTILTFNFMTIAVNSWFRPEIGQALQGGLDLAVDYYQRESRRLEDFVESDIFRNIVRSGITNPFDTIDLLLQVRPELSSIQIVDNLGVQLVAYGPTTMWFTPGSILQEPDGRLVRSALVNHDILRIKQSIPLNEPAQGAILLSTEIAPEFDERARALQQSLSYFTQFSENQGLFTFSVVFFYGFFSLPLLLMAAMLSFYFSDQIIQPILSLEAATRKVAEGDFSFRILSRKGEELDGITQSFNTMISELEKSRNKLVHSERVAAWKDMAQRLAHEIKNPLTPIKLSAERLVRKYGAENYQEILEQASRVITTEVDRLSLMLTEFREFARLPNPEPELFELEPVVQEITSLYEDYPNICIDISGISRNSMVYGDSGQIRQVLQNLIKNAIEACEYQGTIRLNSYRVTKSTRDFCRILVADDGPGIPEDTMVFTPYYTTKPTGSGLGLSIVERIVADHGGSIYYESAIGVGTTFYLDFPYG
jgi:two-component system nitrogen regulation sensor histidine kinase NtrY